MADPEKVVLYNMLSSSMKNIADFSVLCVKRPFKSWESPGHICLYDLSASIINFAISRSISLCLGSEINAASASLDYS